MTRVEIRISGLGGQGVVLAGQILGRAATYDGKNVVQTQSYGAEARGSAAKSEVIISENRIGYPLVRNCDILVAMSQSALNTHVKDLKEEGTLLVDEDHVKEIPHINAEMHRLPATNVAESEMNSRIYANVIMLGALIKIAQVTTKESMEKAITNSVRKDTVKANLLALMKGFKLPNHI